MKTAIAFLVAAILLLFFASVLQNRIFRDYRSIKQKIGNNTYTLYIANTSEKREKGLSNIPSIKSNEGMIFLFDKPDRYLFWMKEMRFNIDFIFLADGKVVGVLENVSPASYPQTFTNEKAFDSVVELSAHEIKQNGVRMGDTLF